MHEGWGCLGGGNKGSMPEIEKSRAWLQHCLRSQPGTNSLDLALYELFHFQWHAAFICEAHIHVNFSLGSEYCSY